MTTGSYTAPLSLWAVLFPNVSLQMLVHASVWMGATKKSWSVDDRGQEAVNHERILI